MGTFYKFEIRGNEFLRNSTIGCYSIDFLSYRQSGELSFLHKLKNNWLKNSDDDLFKSKDEAVNKIYNFLVNLNSYSMKCDKEDSLVFSSYTSNAAVILGDGYVIPGKRISFAEKNVYICRIPRSKVNMQDSQLLFQAAVREAIELVNDEWSVHNKEYNTNYKLIDGINCIKRIKDVPTTHLTGDRACLLYTSPSPRD